MDESTKRGLLAAYGRLLRPLVRILIRNEVVYEDFAETAKEAFIHEAQLALGERPNISDSEIGSLAGLNVDDVEQIKRKLSSRETFSTVQSDQIVSILAGWYANSEFTGPYGLPIELKLKDPDKADFSDLVSSCNIDGDPRFYLDALVKANVVKETEPGFYRILSRYYIPEGTAPDFFVHMARTLEDLANTLDHNQSESDPKLKMFQREVYTEDGIREEDLADFAKVTSDKAKALIDEVDVWLTTLDKPDEGQGKRLTTGLSIFHYVHREGDD